MVIEGAGMLPGAGVVTQPTGTPAAGALAAGSHEEGFLAQIHMIQSRLDDFKNEICSTLSEHKRFMVTMNQNICRNAIQPVVCSSVNSQHRAVRNSPPRPQFCGPGRQDKLS